MRHGLAVLALCASAPLAGCGILVDRYQTDPPAFTVEYGEGAPMAIAGVALAEEYCAVYGARAEPRRTEQIDGDAVAVWHCL